MSLDPFDPVPNERPATYEFRVCPSIHDRHIRIDDEVIHLGGSMSHAGKADSYTIVPAGQTLNVSLDDILKNSVEWFGQTVTVHRKQ